MLFSSLVFLWYFLPAVLIGYHCLKNLRWKNALLLFASIFFYAWGEPKYVILMVISIALNYVFGMLVAGRKDVLAGRLFVTLAVIVNLGLLGYFKYFNFFGKLLNAAFGRELLGAREIALPIGISFYTFQALSYVIDVYRGTISVQKNPWRLALYVSFFPQLIAGPIVKYHDIESQLGQRSVTWEKSAYGVKRFCFGLGKKVILANTFAAVVDRVLQSPNQDLAGRGLIWFTVLLYALQIYYDFSGYSDMAIGLGKLFGFDFMENFNYPYLSMSIREFWRRWHISLSTWFREYVYIPLGGNRKGRLRTYGNLFLVFLTTGLWHGAGANFVLWGAYYGVFIVAERLFLGDLLDRLKEKRIQIGSSVCISLGIVNRVYTLGVVYFGWLLFRAENLSQLKLLARKMIFGGNGYYTAAMFADRRIYFYMAAGLLLCGPLQAVWKRLPLWLYDEEHTGWLDVAVMAVLILFCTMLLVNNTYNPFIYFRF